LGWIVCQKSVSYGVKSYNLHKRRVPINGVKSCAMNGCRVPPNKPVFFILTVMFESTMGNRPNFHVMM
jgi:hypothetical protein